MDELQVKNMAKTVARTGSFVKPIPSFFARQWFSEKTIRQVIASKPSGTAEREVKNATLAKIISARGIVKAKLIPRDRTLSSQEKEKRRWLNKSLVQIVYGALGIHPEFYDVEFTFLLNLTIRRRLKVIERMYYFVNPSSLGYFHYPSANGISLNPKAAPYWDISTARLSAMGRKKPREAIKKIFDKSPHGGNMVYCTHAANLLHLDSLLTVEEPTLLHLDSLLTVEEPTRVFEQFVAQGEAYIDFDVAFQDVFAFTTAEASPGSNVLVEIEEPLLPFHAGRQYIIVGKRNSEIATVTTVGSNGNAITFDRLGSTYEKGTMIWRNKPFEALSDPRPLHGWFEERLIDVEDLQVGDHVFLMNHPLYLHMVPQGTWSGEHSFVMRRWRKRDPKTKPRSDENDPLPWDKETISVQGHGMSIMRLEVATNVKMLGKLNLAIVAAVEQLKSRLEQNPSLSQADVSYEGNTTRIHRDRTKEDELTTAGYPIQPFHCWYVEHPPYDERFYFYRLDPPSLGDDRRKKRGFLKINRLRFQDLSGPPLFRQGSLIPAKVYVRRPRVNPFE